MLYHSLRGAMLNDPKTSLWLRHAILALDRKHPRDARRDLEQLVRLTALRVESNP